MDTIQEAAPGKQRFKRAIRICWSFIRTQQIPLLTSLVALIGGLLAFLHQSPLDIYLIACEWIIFLSFVIVASKLWVGRSAPLCHIIFVSKQGDDFIATTEYYRSSLSSGRILADALHRAREKGVCSVTYYEGEKQFHIPLTSIL